MNKKNLTLNHFLCILVSLIFTGSSGYVQGQQNIEWQKSIGTAQSDDALKMFTDDDGNLVILGNEVHQDFTGNYRNYLLISKIDLKGQEIWKKYHDLAYETFNIPVDYYFGPHFYTEDNGQKLISVVVSIGGRRLLYKIMDETGEYYSYSDINPGVYAVDRSRVEVSAITLCSFQQSCYGPDSLIVQKQNPFPIIGFDPVQWSFELKQNIRTAPIQGHYDFNNQDITTDAEGNVYLLTQIERWDFQFCTDCADAFIDAYCEIFKFDTSGTLVKQVKLKTAKAVVSNMRFVTNRDGKLLIRIDDINAAWTAVITSLYFLNDDLSITHQFSLDKQYNFIAADEDYNLFTCSNVYDQNDPNIKGESDVLISKFNSNGVLQWKSYFGGTSFDYPKGMVLTKDDGLAFFVNTESTDFDIAENHGGQDMWLVKLNQGTTGIDHYSPSVSFATYPNPCTDFIEVVNFEGYMNIDIYDLQGQKIIEQKINPSDARIPLNGFPGGMYFIKGVNEKGQQYAGKILKL
ncbi:MAG TPA: T9SS type A sorting domain-containing protein [Saprospiraceae bacterium]|nr:T9SS type A sorting domain-containing protein [Saprospiraceae bacterium]